MSRGSLKGDKIASVLSGMRPRLLGGPEVAERCLTKSREEKMLLKLTDEERYVVEEVEGR